LESPFNHHPAREVPACPICEGTFERVYSRFGENVFVCMQCHTGLTVPRKAWDIADVKRRQQGKKPDEKTW
jgi:uncharacterized protein YbbK (DUF523 family)